MVVHTKMGVKRLQHIPAEHINTQAPVVSFKINNLRIKLYGSIHTCTADVLKHIGCDTLVIAFDKGFKVLKEDERVHQVYERCVQIHRDVYLIGVDMGRVVENDFYRINENLIIDDESVVAMVRAQLDRLRRKERIEHAGLVMTENGRVGERFDAVKNVKKCMVRKGVIYGYKEKGEDNTCVNEGVYADQGVMNNNVKSRAGQTMINTNLKSCVDQKIVNPNVKSRSQCKNKCPINRSSNQKIQTIQYNNEKKAQALRTTQKKEFSCKQHNDDHECDFYGLLDLTYIERLSPTKHYQHTNTKFINLYKYIKSKLSRHVSSHKKHAVDERCSFVWKCDKYKFVFCGTEHECECIVNVANELAAHKSFMEVCLSLDSWMRTTKGMFALLYEHQNDAVLFTWGIPVKDNPMFTKIHLYNFKSAPECYTRDLSVNIITYGENLSNRKLVGVKHMSLTRHVIFVLVSIKPRYIPVSQVSKFMTFYKYVCERISKYEGMVLTEDMLFSYFLLPSTSCARHFAMDVYREFKSSFNSKMQIVMHTDEECARTIDRFITCDAKNSLAKIAKRETEGILFTRDILRICEEKEFLKDSFQVGRCNEIDYYKLSKL